MQICLTSHNFLAAFLQTQTQTHAQRERENMQTQLFIIVLLKMYYRKKPTHHATQLRRQLGIVDRQINSH